MDPSLAFVNNVDSTTYYIQEIVIEKLEHRDVGTYSCSYSIGPTMSLSHNFHLQNVRLNESDPFIQDVDFQGHPQIIIDQSHGKKVAEASSSFFICSNSQNKP